MAPESDQLESAAVAEPTPGLDDDPQSARRAQDQRDAEAYAERHGLGLREPWDLDWCVACGYGHVDPSLRKKRLPGGH